MPGTVDFLAVFVDPLLAEILARDTAAGPDWRLLNADQADRRILLERLSDSWRELDVALTELEER